MKLDTVNEYFDYPQVEMIEFARYPDYIRIDPCKNDEWYIYQFLFLKKYLKKVITGWSLCDFFENVPANKIALYSKSVFVDDVIDDLRRRTDKRIIVSDKAFVGKEISDDAEFVAPHELFNRYKSGEISKIVVCSVFFENQIMDELISTGFNLNDLVTLSNILVLE